MTSNYDYDSRDGGENDSSIRRTTTTSVFETNSNNNESNNENNSNNNSNNNNPSDNTSHRIPPKKRRLRNSEMNDGIGSDFIALNGDNVGEGNQSLPVPGSVETSTKEHHKSILRLQEEILLLESSISNLNQRRFEKNYHLMQELEKGKRLYEEMTLLQKEYKQLCQKKKRQSNVYQRIQNSIEANQIRYKRLQSIKVDDNDNDGTIKEIQQLVHDTSSIDDIESSKTNISYSTTTNIFTGSESSTIIDRMGTGYSEDND